MANNSSLYGSTPSSTGNISSSNLTTLYSGNAVTVPSNGNLVIPGTLTVNGCVILSDCSTFSILPHTPAITIGETGGTTTILSQLATANYSFPVNDGTTGQVLTTNGSGDLSFTSSGSVGRTYNIDATATTGGTNFNLTGSDSSIDTVKFANGVGMNIVRTDANTITFNSTGAITYNQTSSSTTGGANLNLIGSDSTVDSIKFASGAGILVSSTDGNTITIANNSPGTTYAIDASTTTGGANFNLTGSDSSLDTIKFANGTGMSIVRTDANTITFANTSPGTTYTQNASATTGGANLNLVGSDSTVDTVKFASGTGIVVSRTDADTITITNSAPDTTITYTQDISSTTNGANLNLRGSDASVDTVKFANGSGIAVAYTDASTATVTNTGVTSNIAGSGISVSSATGAVTVANTGVLSNIGGVGIAVSSPTGNVTFTNTGVTSLTTNTGLSTNVSATGAVTVTNTGVTSLTTNTGLSTNVSATGAVTVTNTGVTSAIAGTGVAVSSATGAVTFSIGQDVSPSASPTFAGETLNGALVMNGATSGSVSLSVPAIAGSSTMIFPTGNDVLVGRNTTDTLTNKSISGVTNTLSGIANSSLVNSSITLGTTNIALGATSLAPAGLTSVTVTQDPVSNLQLATKQYVDTKASTGITYHDPVHLASTTDLGSVLYNNGVAGVGATLTNTGTLQRLKLDNSNTTTGDRVLIKNETNQTYNGVYVVTVEGNGSTPWVLTRASDADTYGSAPGQLSLNDYFFVQTGVTQKGNAYILNAPAGVITFGTSLITFAEFSSSQVYTATAPIVITGTDISLATVPISFGGTGQTTANDGLNALLPSQSGNAGRVLYTDGTNTSWTNFGDGFTTGNITIAVATDNTISTTAGNLVLDAATNQVDITSNLNVNSGVLYVDGAKVGVNTTSPGQEFTISDGGDGYVQFGMSNTERLWMVTNNAGDDLISFSITPTGGSTSNRLQFDAASDDQWFPTGQLGIGTGAPAYELDVYGTGRFTQDLKVEGGNINTAATTANIFTNTATTINIGGAGDGSQALGGYINIGTPGETYSTTVNSLLTQNATTTQATGKYLNVTQTTPYLIMSTTRKSMRGMVTIENNVTNEIHTMEYLALSKRSTTDAYITVYAELFSAAPLGTLSVVETGSGLYLYVNLLSTNSTDVTVMRNSLGD